MAGNKTVPPAEPLGAFHMPSNSFVPFVMSLGLFISGFGFSLHTFFESNIIPYGLGAAGLVIFFLSMVYRSLRDDHGYDLDPQQYENSKGVQG